MVFRKYFYLYINKINNINLYISHSIYSVVRSGNDGSLCAVNPLFLAIVVDYAFVVIPVSQTGRIDFQCNKVIGHTGQILDLKWNPFNDCVIASASDDCSVSAFYLLHIVLFTWCKWTGKQNNNNTFFTWKNSRRLFQVASM